MLKIKKMKDLSFEEYNLLINRFGDDFTDIMINTVVPIVNSVKSGGDKAVLDYTEKFDNVRPESILVSEDEIEEGWTKTPEIVKDAFSKAAENIREFHSHQIRKGFAYQREGFGKLGMIYQPVKSAGIYVPGGKAAYPSSVLMGVIPAQAAGVENITLITPPGQDGKVNPSVLAMCRMLGIDTILKSGGAQGIAAAGFGTETIVKSDIIVGPGNIFVTAAKSYLFSLGVIQIDSLAGPSEVLIAADDSANPQWVAWDLLSQAEHEENALAVLVTPSIKLAEAVQRAVEEDLNSGRGRSDIKKKSVAKSIILITDTIEEAVNFSNDFGPEHMELMVNDPESFLDSVKNVGSLFLGHYAPVAIGDYFSGTNHVLPTGGAARFSSGLSVETFYRRTTYQLPTSEGLREALDPVKTIAEFEGFDDKHGDSLAIRFR